MKERIDAGATDATAITADMFDEVQKAVFEEMFHNTYQRFKDSPAYEKMKSDIKNAYNKVRPADRAAKVRLAIEGHDSLFSSCCAMATQVRAFE